MADQLLKTYDLGFRLLRKTKAGTTDLVVYQGSGARNIRAYGSISSISAGYCHLEFTVAASDCTITTLNDTAINPSQGCGFISFEYDDNEGNRTQLSVIITDFVQESASPDYKIYVNGWAARQRLPPLV